MDSFTLYPAIDVRGGRIVRLAQGDYAQETRYGDDPLALARKYAAQGARWLHLVDLDAARAGGYTLATLGGRIAGEAGLQVQTGGAATAAGTRQEMARRSAQRGARHLLCTDISRDGMLTGPNLELSRLLAAEVPGVALQASGGVRELADVLAARELGCAGIVLGRSLLEGRLELPDAIGRVAAGPEPACCSRAASSPAWTCATAAWARA